MNPAAPNIIWLYCDELRADALGPYADSAAGPGFSPRTPAIDALAENAVVFRECFTNSPVCVPARTAILTGQPPERTGVYHNEAYADGFPMPAGLTTFPEVFAGHGYRTASFGKHHAPAALTPWQHTDSTGGGMRDPFSAHDPAELDILTTPGTGFIVAGTVPEGGRYLPERVTDHTVDWIAEHADTPFLVRASYLQPHTPVIVPHEFSAMRDRDDGPGGAPAQEVSSPFEAAFADVSGGQGLSAAQQRRARSAYHNLVSWIDSQVARIVAALQRAGVADRTVIVLTSDHGAHLGETGAFGKHTFAPQAHRVPLIIAAPGLAPGHREDLAQSIDLARTLFGLCGIDAPDSFGGRDLFVDPAPRAIFATIGFGAVWSTAFPNKMYGRYPGGHAWPRRSCVRTDRFRFDMTTRVDGRAPTPEEEEPFLADRAADAAERTNLAEHPRYRSMVTRLRDMVRGNARGAVEIEDAVLLDLCTAALRLHRPS
ncbi:sulfatase-like hydrolase/transferase [Nocardia sp. NBC_01503]|uniref:sulfatase-like hydrolase/transferase n=1 Tax=Nocardia sp. NBC_01503 TaxID=2975997 RepID=UPI002E7B6010|nr:sulfatase-like hydrolase/transferase [Nocardia sp. NBC_01503]WTL31515.1 sulfatase-like hydrolase/transferase [Nocardia sp. NBC_01503]